MTAQACVPLSFGAALGADYLPALLPALDQHALVSVTDAQGRLLYVNGRFCEVSGYAREELLGRTHRLIRSGHHDEAFYAEMWRTISSGGIWQGEIKNRAKDGREYWVASTIMGVADADGQLRRYVSIRTDVTALKQVEADLRLYAEALAATKNGVVIADARAPDLPLVYVNPGFTATTGYAADEAIGRNCRFLHGDDNAQPGLDRLRVALRERRSEEVRLRNYRKDGSLFYNAFSISPVRDAGGRVSHFIGVSNDVTEQVLAQQALEGSEARWRALMENASDAILLLEGEGIVACNREAERLTGYSRSELVGLTVSQLCPDSERLALTQSLQRLGREGRLLAEHRGRRKDGSCYEVEVKAALIEVGGASVCQCSLRDVTQRREEERRRLEYLADYDALTALPNRRQFLRRLQACAGVANEEARLALLLCKLERFRDLATEFGSECSDALLLQFAERLRQTFQDGEFVARTGPSEFAVLVADLTPEADPAAEAQHLLRALATPFQLDRHAVWVSGSVGVAVLPDQVDAAEELQRAAELALAAAKGQGGGCQVYEPSRDERLQGRVLLETELRNAIAGDGLRLLYQPQFAIADRRLVGVEALVRWEHPRRGQLSPGLFVPLAEETGLIVPLGEWVLRQATRQALAWQQEGFDCPVAVNVSAQQLLRADLPGLVEQVLAETGLPPRLLVLELTESALAQDVDAVARQLTALSGLGVRLAVDDFGTGYSSLSYLKRFPLDKLKIDQSFVRETPADANDSAITKAVIALARALQLEVIAEGVETRAQLEFLQAHGCAQVQGFLFSRPLVAEQVLASYAPGVAGHRQ